MTRTNKLSNRRFGRFVDALHILEEVVRVGVNDGHTDIWIAVVLERGIEASADGSLDARQHD